MPSKKSTPKDSWAKPPVKRDDSLRVFRIQWNRRRGRPAPLRPDELPTTEQLANLAVGVLALKSDAGAKERRQAAEDAMEIWRECAELGIIEKHRSLDHWTRQDQKDAEHPPELGLIAQKYAGKHGITLPDMAGRIITWEEAVSLFSPRNRSGGAEDESRYFKDAEKTFEKVVRAHGARVRPDADLQFWKSYGFQRPEFWNLIYQTAEAERIDMERVAENQTSQNMSALSKRNVAKKRARAEARKTGNVPPL